MAELEQECREALGRVAERSRRVLAGIRQTLPSPQAREATANRFYFAAHRQALERCVACIALRIQAHSHSQPGRGG